MNHLLKMKTHYHLPVMGYVLGTGRYQAAPIPSFHVEQCVHWMEYVPAQTKN